jgi:hypothetical protein
VLKLTDTVNPIKVTLKKCEDVGVLLKEDNYPKSFQHLVVCEAVSQFDKKRIYLRSKVKIVNELQIDFDLNFGNNKSVLLNSKNEFFFPIEFVKTEEFNIRPVQ